MEKNKKERRKKERKKKERRKKERKKKERRKRRKAELKFSRQIFFNSEEKYWILGLYFTLGVKSFLHKLSATGDGPEKSTETRKE